MSAVGDRSRPTLAVIGATGAVGTVLCHLLGERQDVWGEVRLVASAAAAGETRVVRGEDVVVRPLTEDVFDGVDVAMFSVPPDVATTWAPIAVAHGAVVIDNSQAFRREPDVPLVVRGYNGAQVRNRPRGIISNPTCTTLIVLDSLGALHGGWGLCELVMSSYQAASGVGRPGMNRLYDEVELVAGDRELGQQIGDVRRLVTSELEDASPFPAPLALNVVPWVGTAAGHGWSTEEMSIRHETRKILDIPTLKVAATCVRVPVVTTHAIAVHATFERELTLAEARTALMQAPNVVVLDDIEHDEWPTPVDVTGSDPTFVGRLRQSSDYPNSIDYFVCGDNLRKGAALNTAQIGEILVADLVH